jgi:hypothetical protein
VLDCWWRCEVARPRPEPKNLPFHRLSASEAAPFVTGTKRMCGCHKCGQQQGNAKNNPVQRVSLAMKFNGFGGCSSGFGRGRFGFCHNDVSIRYRELNLLLQGDEQYSGDTCEQDHHLQSPKPLLKAICLGIVFVVATPGFQEEFLSGCRREI